jgi:hypothetical protein
MRPATGFPSRRPLRLAGLPHGEYVPNTSKTLILKLHILLQDEPELEYPTDIQISHTLNAVP